MIDLSSLGSDCESSLNKNLENVDLTGKKQLKKKYKVTSDTELAELLPQFEQIYQPWISEKDWLQCQLAVAEGFTNAVEHAHKNLPPTTTIDIEVIITKKRMEIRIFDYGPGFDLEEYIKQLKKRNEENCERGRGIPILLKIANHLSYERTNDNQRNCLLIIKEFTHTKTESNP